MGCSHGNAPAECTTCDVEATLRDIEDTGSPHAALIRRLVSERDEAREALNEREADMHTRIRADYDKTVADCWRAKVAGVERERDEARAEVAIARTEALAKCHRCGDTIPVGTCVVCSQCDVAVIEQWARDKERTAVVAHLDRMRLRYIAERDQAVKDGDMGMYSVMANTVLGIVLAMSEIERGDHRAPATGKDSK